jgi:L-glutamine-phosphate cytidylyltransferase
MIAVILAAGMGSRLRPLTETIPKALIPVEGISLLERSLINIQKHGIKKVMIVTGYKDELIREAVRGKLPGLSVSFVHNRDYETTGSMVSLLKARSHIHEDSLLFESDLLYCRQILSALIGSAQKDAILISDLQNAGDDVYVCTDGNGFITDLGKNMLEQNRLRAGGCLVGISALSYPVLQKLFEIADERLHLGIAQDHYEECILAVAQMGQPIGTVHCKDLPWTEIDNEADYRRAREDVFPTIQKLEGRL